VYPINYDSDIDYAIKFVETFTNPNVIGDYKSLDAAVTSGGTISSNVNVVTTTTSDITNPSGGTSDGISSGDDGITSDEINSRNIYVYSNEPAIKLMELHNNRIGREVSYNMSIIFNLHTGFFNS